MLTFVNRSRTDPRRAGASGAPGKRSAWRPKPVDRQAAAPSRLGEVLVGAQAQMAKMSGAYLSQEQWRGIVGARIAGRTRVGKKFKSTLTIKVASSAWCNELSFLQRDLVMRLQGAGHDVTKLRLVVDDTGMPKPALNPFSRAAKREREAQAAARKGEGEPQRNRPLDQADLPEDLRARLTQIEDPNLRAAIAEAARWSLGKKG